MRPTSVVLWRILLPLAVALAVLAIPASARPLAHGDGLEPRGVAAMTGFDRLPYFREGTTVHQTSSFDRTGGNLDRTNYLYGGGSRYVVMEETGPGCIYRIWATRLQGIRIKIYFDNEPTPRVDEVDVDFFSGSHDPFRTPLVGNSEISSGGYYCYYPFPFREGVRIEFSGRPYYYQITYHRYSTAEGVTTFTPDQDMTAVYQAWSQAGIDPKDKSGNVQVRIGPFDLPGGQSRVLLTRAGAGSLRSFMMSIPQLATAQHGEQVDILRNVWVQMRWEGEQSPSVDVPLGFFYGVGSSGMATVRALLTGCDPQTGSFYNYFPMPFSDSAEVALVNRSNTEVRGAEAVLEYSVRAYEGLGTEAGRFKAVYRQQSPTISYSDYVLLDVPSGRGHVVGTIMNITQGNSKVLEGDERIFVDALGFDPEVHGTGTEDFFGGGYYFNRGAFSLPVHGCPLRDIVDSQLRLNAVAMYRLSLADAFPFESGLAFGFEHGDVNNYNANFESAVFAYLIDDGHTLIQTDTLKVGDAADRTRHGYSTSGQFWSASLNSTFVGRDDGEAFSGAGKAHMGSSVFSMSISDRNNGVRLARILDYSSQNQKARVYVDGNLAGLWFTPGKNATHRALYDFVELPPDLTRGKSSIQVRIDFLEGGPSWNEFVYYAYSHVYSMSVTPTFVPTPTCTSSLSPSATLTPTAIPASPTPTCTLTSTVSPSPTASNTMTATASPSLTATPTATFHPSPTATPSQTASSTLTHTPTPSLTATPYAFWLYLPILMLHLLP